MPTKTKPKTKTYARPDDTSIKVSEADLSLLYETVNIDPAMEVDRAEKFSVDIQKLLNRRAYKLMERLGQPLPAHVVAVLKPIENNAAALAALLNPNDLSLAVQHALDMPELDDGSLWYVLTRLRVASQVAIHMLGAQSGSGQKNHCFAQEIERARAELDAFFKAEHRSPDSQADSAVLQEYEVDRKEFMHICNKYLPKSPSAAKPKRAKS